MSLTEQLLDLDAPEAIIEHAKLIRSKPLLRLWYEQNLLFFRRVLQSAPPGAIVELGSGGGITRDALPNVITSDVRFFEKVDLVFSGTDLPFRDSSVAAVMMTNVFHHIPDVHKLLTESSRVLTRGGIIVMIEPANSFFGRIIYRNFHHEEFDPGAEKWTLPPGGPMTSANGALPWIVFRRDREIFQREFPEFTVERYEEFGPLLYLLSGGLSHRQLLPSAAAQFVTGVEKVLSPLNSFFGLFARIVLRKSESA